MIRERGRVNYQFIFETNTIFCKGILKYIYFCYVQNANKLYKITLLDFASNDNHIKN